MKTLISFLTLTLLFNTAFAKQTERGHLYDYDPGADKNSRWPDLFAETPNYRAFGKAVIGGKGEKFRWKMGPMWYRGRLEANKVKVFIVGQEGAQDENVSNRSFTGSTGTRMQKFLNYLGIDSSYLFMNTFVYTITGQYSLFGEDREDPKKMEELKRLLWLAQDPESIIVKHRHELFDYMLETNKKKLALVIGVGTAGKDSVATWFQSHGEKCSSSTLSSRFCLGSGELDGVLAIGVRHPGSASPRNGGSDARGGLREDFQEKANIVAEHIQSGKIKLPQDRGMSRDFTEDFQYGYASIPHRDFAFGTNWQMGKWATTSNRRSSHTIQVFSENGCYNNAQYVLAHTDANKAGKCIPESANPSRSEMINLHYQDPESLLRGKPQEMTNIDVPYESPKSEELRRSYDEGPSKDLAKSMIDFFTKISWNELGVTQDLSFGPTGVYRGRAENAKLLVLADQFSHTDMFSGRALTGEQGQRLQSLLKALGVGSDYIVVRTLPVDTLDLSNEKRADIALDTKVVKARNNLLKKVAASANLKAVLFLGPLAERLESTLPFNLPTLNLKDISESESSQKEVKRLVKRLAKLLATRSTETEYSGETTSIPREDLPMGTRFWMGTSGDAAARAYEKVDGETVFNGNYYRVYAPNWAVSWRSSIKDLNAEEKASLNKFKEAFRAE